MIWSEFFKQVRAGQVQNTYLFTGPEAHVKESALALLREKLLPTGLEALNETVLEDVSAQQIIEACETMPMLCERRLVVVRDYAVLMPGKARQETEQCDRLAAWLPTAPSTCTLVFFLRDAFDGRKKLSSTLVKLGAQVTFEYLDDAGLEKWIASRAKAQGASVDGAAARQLMFVAGRALTRLEGELAKLFAYAGPDKRVTEAMVDALVTPSIESTVFQMIDALMDGAVARATALLARMLQSGETRIGVLFMLTRQMRNLTHIKLLASSGAALPQIEKQLSLNHYAARRMAQQASRFSAAALETSYRACVDADFQIKSGRVRDEAALDRLLLTLGTMEK